MATVTMTTIFLSFFLSFFLVFFLPARSAPSPHPFLPAVDSIPIFHDDDYDDDAHLFLLCVVGRVVGSETHAPMAAERRN